MKELGRSRTVIVIWTKNSTTSHWVRSLADFCFVAWWLRT
jgi:hypothetical protein